MGSVDVKPHALHSRFNMDHHWNSFRVGTYVKIHETSSSPQQELETREKDNGFIAPKGPEENEGGSFPVKQRRHCPDDPSCWGKTKEGFTMILEGWVWVCVCVCETDYYLQVPILKYTRPDGTYNWGLLSLLLPTIYVHYIRIHMYCTNVSFMLLDFTHMNVGICIFSLGTNA